VVLDVSDPSNPTLVGQYDTAGTSYGVYVSGNYAYIADFHKGLSIVDVSNPSKPKLIGRCATPGHALDVYVSGNHAYVAGENAGLVVVDVSDPSNPKVVAQHNTTEKYGISNAFRIHISGNYAYIADWHQGLVVFDVSTPSNPSIAGRYSTQANGVYVSGDHAYLAVGGGSGLLVFQMVASAPPVASFTYSPKTPVVNQTVTFDATSSYDPDGSILSYEWKLGDGSTASGQIVSHSYQSPRGYRITLTVTDEKGLTSTVTKSIKVTESTEKERAENAGIGGVIKMIMDWLEGIMKLISFP